MKLKSSIRAASASRVCLALERRCSVPMPARNIVIATGMSRPA